MNSYGYLRFLMFVLERKLKTIFGTVILILPIFMIGVTSVVCAEADISLAELRAEVLENNLEVKVLRKKAKALEIAAPSMGSLQDPIIGFGLANLPVDTFDFDQEPMTQKQIFIAQKFPWLSTLDLKKQKALVGALLAKSRVDLKGLELIRKVSDRWYDLGIIARQLRMNKGLQDLVQQRLRIAETRYATGKGLQQDVLDGQIRFSELISEEIELLANERVTKAKLGELLQRDRVIVGSGPDVPDDSVSGLAYKTSYLLALANEKSPLILAKLFEIDRAKIDVELAQADYLPDFDVRLSYGQREDNPSTGEERADFFSASVAMTVPLYQSSNQDLKLSAAKTRLHSAEDSLTSYRKTLPHTFDTILSEIAGMQDNYRLYTKAINLQVAHLAQASIAAYSVGKVDFSTMLSAQMRLLRFEAKADMILFRLLKKHTELEQLIGGSLTIEDERS